MPILTVDDLAPLTSLSLDKLSVMIADVEAHAVAAAPCLAAPDALSEQDRAVVVATLRGAVLRWSEHLVRDDRQMTAGPFTIGPTPGSNGRKPLLWPTELSALQAVCSGARRRSYVGWLG